MLLGYFDFLVILTLVLLNILFWKKRFGQKVGCAAAIVVGLVLPIISQWIEVKRAVSQTPEGKIYDNFELLYTYLRFPVYWVVLIIQSAILTRGITEETQESKQGEVDSGHSDQS